jgi:hypothetical protein
MIISKDCDFFRAVGVCSEKETSRQLAFGNRADRAPLGKPDSRHSQGEYRESREKTC